MALRRIVHSATSSPGSARRISITRSPWCGDLHALLENPCSAGQHVRGASWSLCRQIRNQPQGHAWNPDRRASVAPEYPRQRRLATKHGREGTERVAIRPLPMAGFKHSENRSDQSGKRTEDSEQGKSLDDNVIRNWQMHGVRHRVRGSQLSSFLESRQRGFGPNPAT